jgi:hypothetical protein
VEFDPVVNYHPRPPFSIAILNEVTDLQSRVKHHITIYFVILIRNVPHA